MGSQFSRVKCTAPRPMQEKKKETTVEVDPVQVHQDHSFTVFTLLQSFHSSLFTLHSLLFTVHSSPFSHVAFQCLSVLLKVSVTRRVSEFHSMFVFALRCSVFLFHSNFTVFFMFHPLHLVISLLFSPLYIISTRPFLYPLLSHPSESPSESHLFCTICPSSFSS